MKRIFNIALSLVTMIGAMTSCMDDVLMPDMDLAPEGYRTIEFMAQVPDMDQVQTKAVDPDGGGVQQMTVFCFDENNFFISTVSTALIADSGSPSLSGKVKITVPNHAVTLQLVGNQNLTYFREDNYRGMSEVDVMSSLEASAGRMIYWARKTVEELKAHNSSSEPVMLLRNQAKITLNVDAKADFEQKGWVVVNSNAFGTVAPYCPEHGFEAPHYKDRPFVTLPDNTTKLGDFLDVRTNAEEYIFETENTADDPIDFIVKGSYDGGEDLYYRISIINQDGEYLRILRNHHYTVNITGQLYYGQKTFAEALEAPATNNVWVSVSDEINAVTDGKMTLTVDKTSVVIAEKDFMNQSPRECYLYYYLSSTGSEALQMPEVTWMEGNNVAMSNIMHSFDPVTGKGTICIELNMMDGLKKREGTLFIKAGRLSRKIKVVTVGEQSFTPAWITSNVYGGERGENITMMFTIPEDCPQELFPMDVLISVNDIDVRNESGMVLPIITRSDERYGNDVRGIGYKYVLNVTGPGMQRVYLETILEHAEEEMVEVTIEAKNFESLTKTAIFRAETDYSIILDNVQHYSATLPKDEVIFYYLVPQKINAPVDIEAHLGENAVWNKTTLKYDYTPVEATPYDEFLFFSSNLDHNESIPENERYFNFEEISPDDWATGGRVHWFKRTDKDLQADKGAVFHMITNTPVSAEVVRIASNPEASDAANQYRSAIFELANYHPFEFSAEINGDASKDIFLDYIPGQIVNIDIDVTSFASADGNVSVDPFGTAFEIYIDAPMLEVDENSELFKQNKLVRHESIPGRYVYRVAADRAEESAYGELSAKLTDSKATSQAGERKRLVFKTKSIVSAGEIRISSDVSKVVYTEEIFRVQNNSITGKIAYQPTNSSAKPIPAGSFVPFEMLPTYNRIGTVTIGNDGSFELRLRNEYKYDWTTDDVKLQYIDADGNIYEKVFDNLRAVYSSVGTIILEPLN